MNKVEITPEQIAAWKKEYPSGVYKLSLESGDVVFVRQPTTAEIEYASMNLMQGKSYTYGRILYEKCRLGGDEIPASDEAKMRGISQQMQQIIEVVVAKVEKL